jgi:hypothetical protein
MNENTLVGKQALLEQLFPNPADRPTTRWLDNQCRRGTIPFIRLGRLIWFDVPAVKQTFIANSSRTRISRNRHEKAITQ